MHFKILSRITAIIFLLSVLSSTFSQLAPSDPLSSKPLKIKKLEIYGSKRTKKDAIKTLFGLDTSALYDSLLVANGEQKLERTNLFSKVDVLTLKKADGVDLYIIVEEKFYLVPYDFGGEYFLQKYGQNEFWWRLRLGMEFNNFRGKMETLRASFSFWDWRSLALSWQKPLLSTPYYFTIGAGIDYYPDEIEWSDNTTVVGRFIAGRKVASRSRVALGLVPIYRSELHSTGILQADSTYKIKKDTLNNYELFSVLGWSSDFRKSTFDPSGGWYLYTDLKSNALYSGKYNPYFQFSSDLRLYHHGIFKDNKVACRIATVFRNTDGGPLNNLQYGGEGTVRGYLHRQFGYRFEVNNCFMMSMEYRFPIYDFPPIEFPFLAAYNRALASLQYRVDGALIFDYGRFSKDFKDLFALDAKKMESGIGIGIGLRVMLPLFEKSVCADLVWGENPYTETLDFDRKPIFHAYLDMFY